jgi:hypothetical protein
MTEENVTDRNLSVSVPVGAIATALVLGLAAVAYTLIGREGESDETNTSQKTKSGGIRRKLGLMTLITLIENDTTRKLLVSVLRAIAKRS